MASIATSTDTAITLMKMALVHLDDAREVFAAADLQQAIDTAEGKPNASVADDEDELVARFKHSHGRAMMRGLLASVSANARACADWWAREGGLRLGGGADGDASIGQCLLDLGLDVRRLPPRSRARLRLATATVASCPREACSRRLVAFQFFVWYVMSAPDFTPTALREGAASDALIVIRSWCETDPGLVKAAAPEFHRLNAHLFQMREGPVGRWSNARGAAQLRLVDT